MKSLLFACVVLTAACSQPDTHPPLIGDCNPCTTPIIGGQTSPDGSTTTDSGVVDSGTLDSGVKDVSDATADVSADTGVTDAAVDTGAD